MQQNKTAVVFPGQGSQSVGMMLDLAEHHTTVKSIFSEASDALGYDLWDVVINGPEEKLNTTVYTQPALLTAAYAVWQILQTNNMVLPDYLAGHSLGEYTALVCADALEFTDAVKLVAARGIFMQEAVKADQGAMAAIIGMSDDDVISVCNESRQGDDVLSPANFNSLGQVVVAGDKASVGRAVTLAKEKGARMAVIIPVSVPSHCELMKPAANRLAALLEDITISKPVIPVINNASVSAYTCADDIKKGLTEQLYMPVRWVETIQYFIANGVDCVVECGPGKVLSGLNKRIDKSLQLVSICDQANLTKFQSQLSNVR